MRQYPKNRWRFFMEQLEAIKKILPLLIADKAVKAVFLKGSIARGENDEF